MTGRRSLDQTRDVLLQAAAEMLVSTGIPITLDNVKMIDVCRAAGLKTAGSAYKIWESQEAFRADLFRYLNETQTASFTRTVDANAEVLRSDEPPRLRELIRTETAANADSNRHTYPTYLALWLAARFDATLAEPFEATHVEWSAVLSGLFTELFETFDLELIPPYTPELFATAVTALAEGFTIRAGATPELVPERLPRPTGPDGRMQDWTLFGCAVEALLDAFTRPKGTARSVSDESGG